MNRRRFIRQGSAAAYTLASAMRLPASLPAQSQDTTPAAPSAHFSFDPGKTLAIVPANFTGLSYESAQLANPDFFSPANRQLVELFRELSPAGVLRIGGGSSEYTTYAETSPGGPPPFETFGPDTSHTVKNGTITSGAALRNLRGFLDSTSWTCLYGLNLGQGTADNAAAEAAAVVRLLGPRLLALQIGNEPDSFRNRFRPATFGPADFLEEWNRFHVAVVERLGHEGLSARFAGPDISNKLPFLSAFADEAQRRPDVVMLTMHYYAMGPAGRPEATLDNLLSAEPKLTTLKDRDLPVLLEAMRTSHLPLRISEMNSCWNGGQPGASDLFASSLWCADVMLRFASLGFAGVNLHGGGDGVYSPIVGSPSKGFTRKPEFFGMQFAQRYAGATMLESKLEGADPRVGMYAFLREGKLELAAVNKAPEAVTCRISLPEAQGGVRCRAVQELAAPAINSKEHISLRSLSASAYGDLLEVPGYTARAFQLESLTSKGGRQR